MPSMRLRPSSSLAPKPANLTFEQAAAVPMAGMTALQGLRDVGQIQAGAEGADQRRFGRGGHVCGAARQTFRGRGHSGVQHGQRGAWCARWAPIT